MKKAVTLVELMVATVLTALILAGMAYVFVSARRYILFNRASTQAMEYGKGILDSFSSSVRQDTWTTTTNPLCTSAGCAVANKPGGSTTLNNISFAATYNVSNQGELRKVKMKINWTEPVP